MVLWLVWELVCLPWTVAALILSMCDIYFLWWAALLLAYWVEYVDPWETIQRREEIITFFPTIARELDDEHLLVPVHGWLYHPKRNTRLRRAMLEGLKRTVLRLKGKTEKEMQLLDKRLSAFLVDNRRGKRVTVQFGLEDGEKEVVASVKTTSTNWQLASLSLGNGHFREELKVPKKIIAELMKDAARVLTPGPRWISFRTVQEGEQDKVFAGRAVLLESEGVSVISDIDDTVRVSMVCDKRVLVRYSFLKKLVSVPGMPDLYRHWEEALNARFHFVSGGPWQFFESIEEFLNAEGFPKATVHLRNFRLKDTSLFAFLSSPLRAKLRMIEPILQQFPKRKFILVGDSGEKDPEVYAEIASKFPTQVKAIFIRRAPEVQKLVPVATPEAAGAIQGATPIQLVSAETQQKENSGSAVESIEGSVAEVGDQIVGEVDVNLKPEGGAPKEKEETKDSGSSDSPSLGSTSQGSSVSIETRPTKGKEDEAPPTLIASKGKALADDDDDDIDVDKAIEALFEEETDEDGEEEDDAQIDAGYQSDDDEARLSGSESDSEPPSPRSPSRQPLSASKALIQAASGGEEVEEDFTEYLLKGVVKELNEERKKREEERFAQLFAAVHGEDEGKILCRFFSDPKELLEIEPQLMRLLGLPQ